MPSVFAVRIPTPTFPSRVIVRAHLSVQSLVDYWQNPTYVEASTNRPELAMQAVILGFVMPE